MGCSCNKKTLAKTLSWRIIASSTTFLIAYIVDGTLKNASLILLFDISIKTTFYFLHERAWEKQRSCFQPEIEDSLDVLEKAIANSEIGVSEQATETELDHIELGTYWNSLRDYLFSGR